MSDDIVARYLLRTAPRDGTLINGFTKEVPQRTLTICFTETTDNPTKPWIDARTGEHFPESAFEFWTPLKPRIPDNLKWLPAWIFTSEISNLAVIASSMIATVSAAIALLAFTQSIAQMRATYRPDVVLGSVKCWIDVDNQENDSDWASESFSTTKDRDGKDDCEIPMYNIGLGSARNITLKWDYDAQRMYNTVAMYSKLVNLDLKIGKSQYPSSYSAKQKIKDDKELYFLSANENKTPINIDYLMNIGANKEPKIVRIPYSYKMITGAYLFYFSHVFDRRMTNQEAERIKRLTEESSKLFKLQLTCNYSDIEGKNYTATYNVTLDTTSFLIFSGAEHGKRTKIGLNFERLD